MNIEQNTARLHAYVNTHTNYKVSVIGDDHIVTRKTWGGVDIEVGCMKEGVFRNHWTDTKEHAFDKVRCYLDQLDREHDNLLASWPRPSVMLTLTELCLYLKTYSEMEVRLLDESLMVVASPSVTLNYSRVSNVLEVKKVGGVEETICSDRTFFELCQRIEDLSGGAVMFINVHERDVYNLRYTSRQEHLKYKEAQVAKMQQELKVQQEQLAKATEELEIVRKQLVKSVETCSHPEKAAWALPS